MTRQSSMISEQLINTFFPKQFLASLQFAPEATVHAPATVLPQPNLAEKLQIARQKLQQPHGPQLLKVLAYLRISCAVMRQMQAVSRPSSLGNDAPLSYGELVTALVAHDRNWWTHCTINSTGCLRSPDAVVDHLLSTVEEFHQAYG